MTLVAFQNSKPDNPPMLFLLDSLLGHSNVGFHYSDEE